jgi:hypothetical protein
MKKIRINNTALLSVVKAAAAFVNNEDPSRKEVLLQAFHDALPVEVPELVDVPIELVAVFPVYHVHSNSSNVPALGWLPAAVQEPITATSSLQAAVLRGEIEAGSVAATDSFPVWSWEQPDPGITLDIVLDDYYNPMFEYAKNYLLNLAYAGIPQRHRKHRTHTLSPITSPDWPVPVKVQGDLIAKIPTLDYINGWLLCGPPGTSKTSYISAAVIDALTHQAYNRHIGQEYPELFVVNTPRWIHDTQDWETRNFEDGNIQPPYPDAGVLAQLKHPILWLEELDDFVPT